MKLKWSSRWQWSGTPNIKPGVNVVPGQWTQCLLGSAFISSFISPIVFRTTIERHFTGYVGVLCKRTSLKSTYRPTGRSPISDQRWYKKKCNRPNRLCLWCECVPPSSTRSLSPTGPHLIPIPSPQSCIPNTCFDFAPNFINPIKHSKKATLNTTFHQFWASMSWKLFLFYFFSAFGDSNNNFLAHCCLEISYSSRRHSTDYHSFSESAFFPHLLSP